MGEPVVFHDRDAEFRTWAREHPDGLVVNVAGRSQQMLHRVTCDHIGDLRTSKSKACAHGPTAAGDLRAWAQWTYQKRPTLCESCEP
jgi:hypothetical protein